MSLLTPLTSVLEEHAGWILGAYYSALIPLSVLGFHRLWLLALLASSRRHRAGAPERSDDVTTWPSVVVQLPIYNELYVARRLLRSVAALRYPRGLLSIQVLDDSTDETADVVAKEVEQLREAGVAIELVRRSHREGYKAGALEHGLELSDAELVAIFDADFVPQPELLEDIVAHFADPRVAMVQVRWDHLNREESILTRAQAVLLDGHFLIEQAARSRGGRYFNFNGTAGVWRRSAIQDSGGWEHDTLTEDLDLSYRAQLRGWSFVLRDDLTAPAELPITIDDFKAQQHRWTCGAVQTARKVLPRVLAAPIQTRQKIEALFHLTSNVSYPLLVMLALLLFPAMVARDHRLATIAWDAPLLIAATLSVVAYYSVSQVRSGRLRPSTLWELPLAMSLGAGLAIHNAGAVLDGLTGRGGGFRRTPKYSEAPEVDRKRYARSRSWSFGPEVVMALYLTLCLVLALWLRLAWWTPFLYLFVQGYWLVVALTILGRQQGPRHA